MFLARVEGSVVATKKDDGLSGRKLLLVRPQLVDESDPAKFRPGKNTIVAVDSVGAGEGELVMFTQGSSARLAPNMKSAPVDAVVVGIVDSVDALGQVIYDAKTDGQAYTPGGHRVAQPGEARPAGMGWGMPLPTPAPAGSCLPL